MSATGDKSRGGLVIQKPGMLMSVQDLGRQGHRQLGICPGGALDTRALVLANRLVGNDDASAGLEITMGACQIRFDVDTRIALCGDDFGARLDGVPVWPQWSVPVSAGQVLSLGGANEWTAKSGLRSWLAVAGGIEVPLMLGSRSTDLKAGFGGHLGRALKKNDRLSLGASKLDEARRTRRAFGVRAPDWMTDDDGAVVLRATRGPEFEQFSAASRDQFWSEAWRVTPQSSRMGSRLDGVELKRTRPVDMLSSAVLPGTVQVPPAGKPIILMGDSQTTGGYPRIANVIRADFWKLARAPLNGHVRFVEVDVAAAVAAWLRQEQLAAQLGQSLAAAGWPLTAQNLRSSTGERDADSDAD